MTCSFPDVGKPADQVAPGWPVLVPRGRKCPAKRTQGASARGSNNRVRGPLGGWTASVQIKHARPRLVVGRSMSPLGPRTTKARAAVAIAHPHQKPFHASSVLRGSQVRISGPCLLSCGGMAGRACERQSAAVRQLNAIAEWCTFTEDFAHPVGHRRPTEEQKKTDTTRRDKLVVASYEETNGYSTR